MPDHESDPWRLGKPDARPNTFIQWKGTDVCIDLYCTCGEQCHFDGFFLYAWQCPYCKRCWEMSCVVEMRPCDESHPSLQRPDRD